MTCAITFEVSCQFIGRLFQSKLSNDFLNFISNWFSQNWPSAKTGANNSSFLKQKASKIQSREEEMVVVWGPSLLVWKKRRQQQNAGSRQVKACMCPSKQKTRRPVMSTGPSPSTSYVCWVWFGKKC